MKRQAQKGSRGTVVAASCVADPTPLRTRSIGTEHEKFGFRKADKRPIDYSEVKHLLLGLVNRRVRGGVWARARRAAPPRTAHAAEPRCPGLAGSPFSKRTSSSAPSLMARASLSSRGASLSSAVRTRVARLACVRALSHQ